MTATTEQKRMCIGADCPNEAGTLQCPTCLKLDIKDSFFCSQDCFKKNWSTHKTAHKSSNFLRNLIVPGVVSKPDPITGLFNPFPTYHFAGPLRPVYPLSETRTLPASIPRPDYARDGIPRSERAQGRQKIEILDKAAQDGMRKVCRLAREVLDIAAAAAVPGVTTDHIDEIVHNACIERNSYPSPLNYCHFPKSVCTSVNEIICHGIPDKRVLVDGDILNIDVTLYHNGYHGDLNETYYIGEKARNDPDSVRVVEAARTCLNDAIAMVKPGVLFRDFGNAIDKHAKSQKCDVVKAYVGHGINSLFHCAPNIPHYKNNKAVGQAKEGMCFTIEPMINLGTHKDKTWPDDWTSSTADGKRSAQFEHTLLVTADGVEVLTARLPNSPGGPVPMPVVEKVENGTKAE
ncbi:methionyl aminopeptidase [Pseudogymnoascus sp. 03VT05]|nr:methionyl aminopeptidase [Pseudogymnoascus sp. 03VT05]